MDKPQLSVLVLNPNMAVARYLADVYTQKPLKTPLERIRAQPRQRPLLPCLMRTREN